MTSKNPPKRNNSAKVDIIVYLYDDLISIKECLGSIVKNSNDYHLIIINDHLDNKITEYLASFSSSYSCVIRKSLSCGYAHSINQAMEASFSRHVVVVDSHVTVTRYWLENMLDALHVDDQTGIVIPLFEGDISRRFNYNLELTATMVENSSFQFPMTLLGRPCFMLRRAVIEKIGLLEDRMISSGNENVSIQTYWLRAKEAGILIRLADNCCVGYRNYQDSAGQNDPGLQQAIGSIQQLISTPGDFKALLGKSILFINVSRNWSGGVHCIIETVAGLRGCGFNVKIAVLKAYLGNFLNHYPEAQDFFCVYTEDGDELSMLASRFDMVIATNNGSVKYVKKMLEIRQGIIPMYFIQDYEAWFYLKKDLDRIIEATRSYTLIPQMVCFTNTNWLCDVVKGLHGISVEKIDPGLDRDVFNCYTTRVIKSRRSIRIVAFIRPNSGVRAPRTTLDILKNIKKKYKSKVDIRVFGCSDEELDGMEESKGFSYMNAGALGREEVAVFLSESDIFVDASEYQALGRTGLEAMAVGCAAVLPKNCGTSEYARNMENCLLAETHKMDEVIAAVELLINDKELLVRIKEQGIKTGKLFSIRKAVWSNILLFNRIINSFQK